MWKNNISFADICRNSLDDQPCVLRPLFAPLHRRLGAPLGGKLADGVVGILAEPQQVAHHPTVQQSAVRVDVGQIGRPEIQFAELVEDGLGCGQLVSGEGAEI